MPSVTNVVGLLEKMENLPIAISQGRCVSVRNRNSGCSRCADACGSRCISIEGNKVSISAEGCIGCGICVTACPTGALMMLDPSEADLSGKCQEASRAAEGEAIIACRCMLDAAKGLYDPEKVVSVPCLGAVGESLILTLAASPDIKRITLVHGRCEGCPSENGYELADAVSQTANVLLEVWGSPVRSSISPKLPSKLKLQERSNYDAGRREFFSDIREGAKDIASTTAEYAVKEQLGMKEEPVERLPKVDRSGNLPQSFPEGRARLLGALDGLGDPEDVVLDTRLWGSIDVDVDACSSCRMCATFCPTGAIFRFHTKKGKIGIKHRSRQCVSCSCCENICPTGALTLSSQVLSRDIATGDVKRIVLPPREDPPSNPHSIMKSMKKLMSCEQIYER